MAAALIANNQRRAPRALTPRAGNPQGEVLVLQWPNMDEEARGIAQIIRERIERQEVNPGGVLVLAPRRQFGYGVRDALVALGVNAHSFFREQALDADDAKQAFTLLTLLANPDDRVALRCWCGFGSSSLRCNAWARIRSHCVVSGESPWAALDRLAYGDLAIRHTSPLTDRFRELRRRLSTLATLRGQALMNAVFPADAEWAGSLRAHVHSTMPGEDFDAERLRESLRVWITQPELPTDVDLSLYTHLTLPTKRIV